MLTIDPRMQSQITDLDFVSEFRAVITGLSPSSAVGGEADQGIRYRSADDAKREPDAPASGVDRP